MSHERTPVTEFLERSSPAAPEDMELENPGESCGVFGIYAPGRDVAKDTYLALHQLQHRGQQGAGVYINRPDHGDLIGQKTVAEEGTIYVNQAIPGAAPTYQSDLGRMSSTLDGMSGATMATGHVLWATNGGKSAQPHEYHGIAVSHNGHFEMRDTLCEMYDIDTEKHTGDSEQLSVMIGKQKEALGSIEEALAEVLPRVEGAFSMTLIDGEKLIGVRDPWAFRPLALGAYHNEQGDVEGYTFASEPVVFDYIGATFIRDLEQGEILIIDENGPRSMFIDRQEERMTCMYEYIYFARPDGQIDGNSVYRARENMGRSIAKNHMPEVDIVIGVKDSGLAAAHGCSKESGVQEEEGLFKNPYIQRTFIGDLPDIAAMVGQKHRPNSEVIEGKRVLVVDDSIIRGNTTRGIVQLLRDAGATEVHVRSAAPRYMHPCYMGMDTRQDGTLIARQLTNEEIADEIEADSVDFLTVEEVKESVRLAAKTEKAAKYAGKLCDACSTGNYPFPVPPCQTEVAPAVLDSLVEDELDLVKVALTV